MTCLQTLRAQVLAVAAAAAVGAAPAVAVRLAGRLGASRVRAQHARTLGARQRRVRMSVACGRRDGVKGSGRAGGSE